MKWFGILFIGIGILLGRYFVIGLMDYYETKNSTTVVEGIVVQVYDNRAEVKHWKANRVTMDVAFERAGIADTVNVCCHCGSQYEDPNLSCGNIGDKKMVRFRSLGSSIDNEFPILPQVTDSGDYYDSTFSFFIVFIPVVFLLLGTVFFWVGIKF